MYVFRKGKKNGGLTSVKFSIKLQKHFEKTQKKIANKIIKQKVNPPYKKKKNLGRHNIKYSIK